MTQARSFVKIVCEEIDYQFHQEFESQNGVVAKTFDDISTIQTKRSPIWRYTA